MSFNIDTSNVSLENLIFTLQKAQEAKELLDTILSYYDIYSGEFTFRTEAEITKIKKKFAGEALKNFKTDKELLNEKIRSYTKFDDSY